MYSWEYHHWIIVWVNVSNLFIHIKEVSVTLVNTLTT